MTIKEAIFGAAPGADAIPAMPEDGIQGALPIADIRDGVICTRDGGYAGLFEVLPVNFFLQNEEERARIVSDFAAWLRIAPASMQILCLSKDMDLARYTQRMEGFLREEASAPCRASIQDNIAQVTRMAQGGALTTRFFIAFRFERAMAPNAADFSQIAEAVYGVIQTARGYLGRCGLTVADPGYLDNFVVETVYGMLCKRTSRHARLPLEFRCMLRRWHGVPADVREAPPDADPEARPEPATKPRRRRKQADGPRGGQAMLLDLICPPSIDFSHADDIVADGVYHSYLYIAGYGYQTLVRGGWLASVVGAGDGVSVSFTMLRRPREKVLPKVSQTTMWSRSRMRDVGDTRQDYEQLDSAIAAGQYIKDQMNRCGEEYYDIYTLIEVTAEEEALLRERVAAVERLCVSQDIVCKRCEYVEEQAFCSFLPAVSLDPAIARRARRNALLTGAAGAFPFFGFELCEQDGIVIGESLRSRSLCMLDMFNADRYSSANAIVLGASGVGKSYLLQLIAMRFRQQQVQVFLIAPYKGYEYRAACEAVGGLYVKFSPSSTDCINFMEIRRRSLDVDAGLSRTRTREDSLLADKISRLHLYFSLLRRDLNEEDKSRLDVELVRLYKRFGITRDNRSLFDENGAPKPQPTPKDFHKLLMEKEETRPLAGVLSRFVDGSAAGLGGQTNIDLNNRYVVLDISEIGKDLLAFGTLLAADICLDYCRRSRAERKVILLDEVWALIGAGSNAAAAEFVLELFKTVRGYSAAAIAASQDLEDFFALENGKFGKALINNSRIKFALACEPQESLLIQEHFRLTDEEMRMHQDFSRGQALLCAGRNRIGVQIVASPREHELITTDPRDLARLHRRQAMERLDGQGQEDEDEAW